MSDGVKRKLIEVALPLDDINREAAREKSIRHGHPSTLHLWWARRPLAACRAVLFASLVDDPSARPDRFPTEDDQTTERERLFDIIRDLVKWENSNNPEVLARARAEIMASCDGNPPPVLDPFAGGGSIPLEAQRLGLEVHASDLNPVAVLINKALIEIPPRFAGQPPVHPDEGTLGNRTWTGAQGLAEDVRYYGRWMRDEAQRRIGHLYPKVQLPRELGGGEATVIAWIWARTVESPNPAWNGHVPLVRSFALSTKKGKETWVEPIVDREAQTVRFEIRNDPGRTPLEGTIGRTGGRCLATGAPIPFEYIRAEAKAGRTGQQLMAIVAEGKRSRIYLPPTDRHVSVALSADPDEAPTAALPPQALGFRVQGYGMTHWADLFTNRQLMLLATLSSLVVEARKRIEHQAIAARLPDDTTPLRDGGKGATAYAEAASVYLALVMSRIADRNGSVTTWDSSPSKLQVRGIFARQAVPMVWDFAEGNPMGSSSGALEPSVDWVAKVVDRWTSGPPSEAHQLDASAVALRDVLVSTDPPYYDNVPYADLSDFFYLWLRRSLSTVYPEEFSTLLVPKTQELVADPFRHGGRKASEEHFESGLRRAFERLRDAQDPALPMTVYYAFKQAETSDGVTSSTGWEVMLQSLIDAGFVIDGTWPMRSELGNRLRSLGSNALATSIVLVCRHRPAHAPMATRREFVDALKAELPDAVKTMQHGNIAPVDLAQASIGPGMAVFSTYSKVLESDGTAMRVRTALELINQVLDDTVAGIDADFDADTRWATTWFEEYGMAEGPYGRAEQLTKSRNTSIKGLVDAGIIAQRPEKVRLKARDELKDDWDPTADTRLTVWEVTQHLIRRLETGGEEEAAPLLHQVGSGYGEAAKELAYRLYLACERQGWAKEAVSYNGLVTVWPELSKLARAVALAAPVPEQTSML